MKVACTLFALATIAFCVPYLRVARDVGTTVDIDILNRYIDEIIKNSLFLILSIILILLALTLTVMCRKIAKVTANYVSDTKTVNKSNRLTPCFMWNHSPICPIAVRSILAYIRTQRVF